MSTFDRLRVVLATPLDEDLCTHVESLEPRVEFLREPSLLPPMRWAADHGGDPAFSRTPEQQSAFEDLLNAADALFGIPDENPAELARAVRTNPRLRWVHTMAAGGGAQVRAAGLTPEELSRVVFTTSAGVHGSPLAEFAVFGVLAGAKSLRRLLDQQARKEWSGRWCMQQLSEMTVAVLGVGSIGQQIAAQLSALGAQVIGVSRSADKVPGLIELVAPERLTDVVSRVDALVVALPGTHVTHKLVNAEVLSAVRRGITLVNVGRGTVIDEEALIGALEDGRVGFAALDVFYTEPLPQESPLWTHPHVLVSPHTAALNAAEDRRIAELFARNATRLLDGDPLINTVDIVEFY